MKFNTDDQFNDWHNGKIAPKLKHIIKMVDCYMMAKYGYEITVTETMRTQKQQDYIYRNSARYKTDPWTSVHQGGYGVDLRTRDMDPQMIADVVQLCNNITYDENDLRRKTAQAHSVGSGFHLHIQCKYV